MRSLRVDATSDVYISCTDRSTHDCTDKPNVLPIWSMSRWLSKDLLSTPLGCIEAEIERISKKPLTDRSVNDADRLADLCQARRQITSGSGRRGSW